MRVFKLTLLTLGFTFAIHGALADGDLTCIYKVKRGDTLSQIAQSFVGEPVYPKGTGSLDRLLVLNPRIRNAAIILPGMRIVLDASGLSEEACLALQNKASERQPANDESSSLEGVSGEQKVGVRESFRRFGIIEAEALLFYSKIEGRQISNGTQANLLSKLNKGIDLRWRQVWSESFRTYVQFGVTAMTFDEPLNRTLENREFTASNFGIGFQYFPVSAVALGFKIGTQEEVFYHAVSLTTLKTDTLSLPHVEANVNATLLDLEPFKLSAGASVRSVFKGSNDLYSTESGMAYRGTISIGQSFSPNASLKSDLFYQYLKQNTSLLEQNRTDLGLSVGFEWRLRP